MRFRTLAPVLAAGVLALGGTGAAATAQTAGGTGTMWGQAIPTPLLLPPGLHARFVAEPVHTVRLASGLVADGAVWTVTSGYPATLEAIDGQGRVTVSLPLPGAYGADAVAAGPGGSVWVGSNPDGIVFRYDPGTQTLTRVAALAGVNTLWSMAYQPSTGTMWAAAYPDGVWAIDAATGQARRTAVLSGVTGARVLGLVGSAVWAGTYPARAAFPLPGTGLTANVLPASLSGSGQMVAIGPWSGGTAVLENSGDLAWLDGQGRLVGVLSDVASLPIAFAGQTVVLRRGGLWSVDLASRGHVLGRRIAQLPQPLAVSAVGIVDGRFAVLAPSGTVYAISPGGAVATYLPPLSAQAGTIQTLAATPWGLWGSAYLGGQVFQVAAQGAVTPFTGLDQVDSMTACANTLYLGTYPSARLYAYDPTAAWNPGTNPRLVGSAGGAQDRAPALACLDGVAYMGTVPGNGQLGGALYASTGHDLALPAAGQTPVSLSTWQGELVGSLSDENALGVAGPPGPARLFAYAPATGQWQGVTLPTAETYAGVLGTAQGVFAASPTRIARWNPATGALRVVPFRQSGVGDVGWGMGTHMFTAAGRLYLVDDGSLYLVNPTTLQATFLFYGVEQAAVDATSAYFSFYDSRWLLRIATARLTPSEAAWPDQFWYLWRHDGHVWPPPRG